jgi:hypothetical protein
MRYRLVSCQSCPVENSVDSVGNLGSFAVDSGWISCGFLGDARPFGHAGLPFSHPPAVDKTPHKAVSGVGVAAFVGFAGVSLS